LSWWERRTSAARRTTSGQPRNPAVSVSSDISPIQHVIFAKPAVSVSSDMSPIQHVIFAKPAVSVSSDMSPIVFANPAVYVSSDISPIQHVIFANPAVCELQDSFANLTHSWFSDGMQLASGIQPQILATLTTLCSFIVMLKVFIWVCLLPVIRCYCLEMLLFRDATV
jgi:hypothetical protein